MFIGLAGGDVEGRSPRRSWTAPSGRARRTRDAAATASNDAQRGYPGDRPRDHRGLLSVVVVIALVGFVRGRWPRPRRRAVGAVAQPDAIASPAVRQAAPTASAPRAPRPRARRGRRGRPPPTGSWPPTSDCWTSGRELRVALAADTPGPASSVASAPRGQHADPGGRPPDPGRGRRAACPAAIVGDLETVHQACLDIVSVTMDASIQNDAAYRMEPPRSSRRATPLPDLHDPARVGQWAADRRPSPATPIPSRARAASEPPGIGHGQPEPPSLLVPQRRIATRSRAGGRRRTSARRRSATSRTSTAPSVRPIGRSRSARAVAMFSSMP